MKQTIQEKHFDEIDSYECRGKKVPYDLLKRFVQEVWDEITEDDLKGLLYSMQQRCQDVIDVHGEMTKN